MPRVYAQTLATPYAQRSRTRSGSRWVLVTVCLAVLLAQIDTSVVNLALRSIGLDLHAAVTGLQWVLDAYNLSYAVLLLTGGLLCDLYGRRRLFIVGAAIFTGGSVLCAAAPGVPLLIAGRGVAGAGAALLLPASLAIIRVAWTEEQARNRALGIWAACNGLAFIIGPALGGVLVDWFGWRSVFLIVVPLGVVAIGFALRVVAESSDPAGRRFDAPGQIFGAMALAGLALTGIAGAHDHALAAVACGVGVIALVLFLIIERRRGSAAMVPLELFRSPRFVGTLTATSAMTFGVYGVLFLVPLVWQSGGIFAAGMAGIALMPMAGVFFVVSNASGRLVELLGARVLISGGTAIIGVGLFVIACSVAGEPLWLADMGLVLTGLGMGLNTGPLFGVAVAAVPAARSGSAASLINVARMIGATLGVAILGTAFALAGAGGAGLRAAMLLGGAVQIVGGAVAWRALR
jgi:MFS transporter, DHA2 family, methylenomycin A resistance protein